MNIIIIESKSFGLIDAKEYFASKKHNIRTFYHDKIFEYNDPSLKNEFENVSKDFNGVDFVFSINFYPSISGICNEKKIKYISIVYDNPHIALFHFSIINPCNSVFVFDSSMAEELNSAGIKTVHYSVLPVNTKRYDNDLNNKDLKMKYDISFVGSMYNEKHNLYDRLRERLMESDQETAGFLDGVIKAQTKVYGYNFLEEIISDDIYKKIYTAYPYDTPRDSVVSEKYVYASYFLGRKVTAIERFELLKSVSDKFNLHLFTSNKPDNMDNCHFMGSIDYYNDMGRIFRTSKINLNITLKSIIKGIPLRALDIMACGGFLVSNYQEDFYSHFTEGMDYINYQDEKNLIDIIDYYLKNDLERSEIARNGRKRMEEVCEYNMVLDKMIKKAGIS
jgi:spore maturation protein CgeB